MWYYHSEIYTINCLYLLWDYWEVAVLKQLSFKIQCYISLAIIACTSLFGQLFKMGILHNICWILIGLLFVVNPVWPQAWDWRDHKELKKGVRIGGIFVIVIFGFLFRYGV